MTIIITRDGKTRVFPSDPNMRFCDDCQVFFHQVADPHKITFIPVTVTDEDGKVEKKLAISCDKQQLKNHFWKSTKIRQC